jgi:hypothetical protein
MKSQNRLAEASVLISIVLVASCGDRERVPSGPSNNAEASDLVRAPVNADFTESDRIQVNGSFDEEARCILRRSYTLPPGNGIYGERIVEFSRSACTFTVARGRWSRLPGHNQGHTDRVVGSGKTVRHTSGPSAGDDGLFTSGEAWQQLWYEDPIGLNVSEDRITLEWQGSQNCGIDDYSYTHDMYWLTATGWVRMFHDKVDEEGDCDTRTVWSWSNYMNDDFCFWDPDPTGTSYFTNMVTGRNGIAPVFEYSFAANGGCAGWLHQDIASGEGS